MGEVLDYLDDPKIVIPNNSTVFVMIQSTGIYWLHTDLE